MKTQKSKSRKKSNLPAKRRPEKTAAITTTETETQIGQMFGGPDIFQIPTDAPLPTIEIMRETQQFKMPTGELVKEFTAFILFWHEANCYWDKPFGTDDAEAVLPACSSSNSIKPDGGSKPLLGPCYKCPMNEYGSALDGGRGKGCQNQIRCYLILEGQRIPSVLKCPPSSLGKKESLIKWLTNAANQGYAGKYQTLEVRFSLKQKQFDKFSASILELNTVRVLDPSIANDMQLLTRLSKLFREVLVYHNHRVAADVSITQRYSGEEAVDEDCPV